MNNSSNVFMFPVEKLFALKYLQPAQNILYKTLNSCSSRNKDIITYLACGIYPFLHCFAADSLL